MSAPDVIHAVGFIQETDRKMGESDIREIRKLFPGDLTWIASHTEYVPKDRRAAIPDNEWLRCYLQGNLADLGWIVAKETVEKPGSPDRVRVVLSIDLDLGVLRRSNQGYGVEP